MTETLSHDSYSYPHQKGEVTDEILKNEVRENPEAYGPMLPHIQTYLDRQQTTENVELDEEVVEEMGEAAMANLISLPQESDAQVEPEAIPHQRRERIIVSDPDLQAALDTLDTIESIGDATDPQYKYLLVKYANSCKEIFWEELPRRDLDLFMSRLADFDKYEKQLVRSSGNEKANFRIALRTFSSDNGIPADYIHKLKVAGRDSKHIIEIKAFMESTPFNSDTTYELVDTLIKIYGSLGAVKKLKPGEDKVLDKLRASDFQTDLAIALIERKPEYTRDAESIQNHDRSMISQSKDILTNKLRLPEDMVEKYGIAVYGRLLSPPAGAKEFGYIDGKHLSERLKRLKECVDIVGVEGIIRLHEELGIVNIDNYSPKDLQYLTHLLDKDSDYIQHLQQGDVTAVFTDAYGDYNGAISQVFDAYRQESGRTIMFEITKPSDLYRRMIMLKNLGIKPSAVVVGAHGAPGKTAFGNKVNGSNFAAIAGEVVKPLDSPVLSFNLAEARLDRLASDEFMQASKGIDDGLEIAGRRRIIINSCSSDVEFNESVPSTAETVARTIAREDVDTFGASDVMYLGTEKNSVQFNGEVEESGGAKRVPNGQKITVKNGVFSRLRRRLGTTEKMYLHGRLVDTRRNGALSIKRTKVHTVYGRLTGGRAA